MARHSRPRDAAGLSKTRLLNWLQCPKRLWLDVNLPDKPPPDAATELVFRQGHELGAAAQARFAGGRLIGSQDDLGAALTQTGEALRGPRRRPLFEAAFERDGVLVRADVLEPARGGAWSLHEVKSTTTVKDNHHADVAVQRWVVQASGLKLDGHGLMHVDSSWTYPGDGDYAGLFARADLTAETAELSRQVHDWVDGARRTLAGDEPDLPMGEQCVDPYPCPYQDHCAAQADQVEYPVILLPGRAGKALARRLAGEGYRDLREVPGGRFADPVMARMHRVTCSGKAFRDRSMAEAIDRLPWPRAYLDFETMNFAVPRWAGARPFQQVPFQWSCHVETAPGKITHAQFLDLGGADPRRACAEQLVAALRGVRVILVYSAPFERGRILELAAAFPDLADELEEAAGRIFDLLPVVREGYYHRDMRCSARTRTCRSTACATARARNSRSSRRSIRRPLRSGARRSASGCAPTARWTRGR
jgi:hypothetical protein